VAYLGMTSPALYQQAIRSGGVAISYTVDALFDGSPVAGATDLRPVAGSIVDTAKPGVRRTLTCTFAPQPGLYDLLAPAGVLLRATANVRLTHRDTVTIPMGVFDVDRQSISDGGGGVTLTAPDKWRRIQRARFIQPYPSEKGNTVTGQITLLIKGALGMGEPVITRTTNMTRVGAMTWEQDRDKAILELAESIGCWVYFDRDGVATIADLPRSIRAADWIVDASANGVLLSAERSRSRENTSNVVVVSSSASEGEKFPPQIVWDDDPSSPTYAGTDPIMNPSSAGPFGLVPYYFDTPILTTVEAARRAGRTILSRTRGLASQVSLGQVPNPAVDAMDALDVLPPRERYDTPRVLERHVADTVTHPLALDSPQNIEGRSTRTEDIEAGLTV